MSDPEFPPYRRLFEASPHPYLILEADADFTIVAVNDKYLEATGTRREAIVGHGLFEIFPDNPDDRSGSGVGDLRASLNRVIADRRPDVMGVQKYDIPLRDGSGGFEVRYWSPVNSPVFGEGGEVDYLVHHVEDVTEFIVGRERARLESAERLGKVEARAERMEAEVMRRAAEVKDANRALKAAMEELERREAELERLNRRLTELDRLKSQFFANVSHELRTPLTLILAPLESRARRADLSQEERREAEAMLRSARLLYRHVTDLLDAARLEAGAMKLAWSPLDLARLARAAAAHFEGVADERRITCAVEAPASLPAQGDGEKIERILLNLLSNAFKFTPRGGRIALRIAALDGRASIEVQDNGPGVPAEVRASVFERFSQAEGGSDRRYGGTGLGLAIVKEFAELHGGTVALEEAAGGGALFRVTLPRAAPPGTPLAEPTRLDSLIGQEAAEELQARAPAPGSGAPDAARPLVLVVEDNVDMSDFLAATLAPRYRVARAFDGREGVDKALALAPDLVLADVMMPGTGGEEMVYELRGHADMADVPVVILTAKAEDALRLRLLESGVQDYLNKPFSVDELLARVGRLISERRQRREQLRESEARFEATFELAAVGIGLATVDGRWLRVNRKLCEIVGYAQEELMARTFQDITHPGDLLADLRQVRRMLAREIASYSMEKRYLRKDASVVWVHLTVALAWKPDGTPDYFIGVVEDIQQRKEAEAALAEQQARHRAVIETTSDGFWMLDEQGRLLAVNDAYVRRSGYSRDELLAMRIPDLEAQESPEEVRAHIDMVRRKGSDLFESRHRAKDGEIWPVEISASYWGTPGGRFFGCFVRDIGERKRTEAALHALNTEMLQLTKRHVASQTAAAIAHELNQPLVAVTSYAEAALRLLGAGNPQPDRLRHAIEGGARQAQRAGQVVRELFAFMKMGEVQTEPVDLNDIARRVLAQAETSSPQRFQSRLELEPGLGPVSANLLQVEKVLANLVRNGVEAMHEAGINPRLIEVDVRTRADGRMAQVTVTDSGPGVDAERAHRIFDPFFTTKAKGLGMGLALSRAIIEAHGGQLWLEIAPEGGGAAFHFTLPFAP